MKLGELFVDLGVNSGNALNSLTNFSIKFLAIKNAASQFADSLDALFGDTARFGQQLVKNNYITGLSVEWMQKMKYRAEQAGSSLEDVLTTMKNLQKANADILMGQGNIAPFQKLNIDMSRLRQPAELLDDIMSKIMRLEPAFRQAMLSELGISENILHMYTQRTAEIDKQLLLTREEAEELNLLNRDWVRLQQTFSAGWDKFLGGVADELRLIIGLFQKLTETVFGGIGNVWDDSVEGVKSFFGRINELFTKDNMTKINPDADLYDFNNMGVSTGASVVYNDNSQTTINTSDGPREYERITNNKIDKNRSEIGNLELFSRRGGY